MRVLRLSAGVLAGGEDGQKLFSLKRAKQGLELARKPPYNGA